MWVFDGWECGHGSMEPWLNNCITRFEKRHPGVYVEIKTVTEEVMKNCYSGEINPPDVILFAPGTPPDTSYLSPIEGGTLFSAAQTMPNTLLKSGTINRKTFALPIAMGGYAWACNTDTVKRLPADWSQTEFIIRAPKDSRYTGISAALIALCAGTETEIAPSQAGSGMELGLSSPSATPEVIRTERTVSRLGSNFSLTDNAYKSFSAKEADAIIATQRDIRRLQLASESGKGPDWTIYPAGEPFTDQLAMFAITNWPREDIDARVALGEELLLHLLSDESQKALTKIRALRVTDGAALYSAEPGMAQLEAAYLGKEPIVPNAFDNTWRRETQTIFSLFAEERISPEAAWSKLLEVLGT